MDVDLDPARLLFAVGALLGIAALLYFGFEVIVSLSPTVKAVALLGGFVAFLAAAQALEDGLETVGYVLGAGSYLVFLLYTVWTFDVGSDGVFLLLAASSGLFVALGYAVGVREWALDDRRARLVVAGVVLVLALLVAVDVAGAQPAVERSYGDAVEVPAAGDDGPAPRLEDGGLRIGTLAVANGFVLSRRADLPATRVCVAPTGREVALRYAAGDDGALRSSVHGSVLLAGGERREYGMLLGPDVFLNRSTHERHGAFADVDAVPVERDVGGDCAGDREEPAIVVTEEGEATVPGRGD